MNGPSKIEGDYMSQWVLKSNGIVVPRLALIPPNVSYIHGPVKINKRYDFDGLIERICGTTMTSKKTNKPEVKEEWE